MILSKELSSLLSSFECVPLWNVGSETMNGYKVPLVGAESLVIELRELSKEFTPVIIGDDNDVELIKETNCGNVTLETEEIDLAQWLRDQRSGKNSREQFLRMKVHMEKVGISVPTFIQTNLDQPLRSAEIPEAPDEWSEANPWSEILLDREYVDSEFIYLVLLQTPTGWESPAHLGFGGFNSCPKTAVHVAMLRFLDQKFGAFPIRISKDTIEVCFQKAPEDRETAWRLMCDFATYAEYEEFGIPIPELAASLVGARSFFFWWD